MSKKYQPSNGSEGMSFIASWCDNCIHEQGDDGPCDILTSAMVFGSDEPDYPGEWTFDKDGKPCCTAFAADRDGEPSAQIMKMREELIQILLF